MARIRFKGFATGTAVDVDVTVGADSGSIVVPAFRVPDAITGLARIQGGAFAESALTVDTTGLAGVTAYDWRIVGGATLATTAGFTSTMMQGGSNIECAVTHDGGVSVSPPWHIYAHHSGAGDHASMMGDDAAITALIPHDEITHLAIADGLWSSPATWRGGLVPANGGRVLIPIGITVTYDVNEHVRLDSLRVDGTLETSITTDTRLLVEHFVITRTGAFIQGTQANRMPANISTTVTISGRDYSLHVDADTDMNLTRDPKLWGRGLINQGEHTQWGAEKQPYVTAEHTAAGATSIVLHELPTGWGVGNQIVVTGTKVSGGGIGESLTLEDEIRAITAINGTTVSFADPLVFDHTNQNPDSDRTDLPWHVKLYQGRNITTRSECTDTIWRRGHCANVHGHTHVDKWFGQTIGMGRTDKTNPVGKIDSNGDFERYDPANDPNSLSVVTTSTLTAQSNLAGRYAEHGHHLGLEHAGHVPIVSDCYFEDSPGWLFSHHSCLMKVNNCAFYDFAGAGLVAEQGNELGEWKGNISGHARTVAGDISLTTIPKIFEGLVGLMGDNFKQGTPFAFRGRAVKSSRNIAYSGSWAYEFYHRSHNLAVFPTLDPQRDLTDLKEAGRVADGADYFENVYDVAHHPILHFADNINQGCHDGFFVTKGSPQQKSDVPIYMRGFVGWGHQGQGWVAEYVAHYNLSGFDLVGGPGATHGISFGQNMYHSGVHNSRIEGHGIAIDFFSGVTSGIVADDFDATDDPRFFAIGNDYQSNTTNVQYVLDGPAVKTLTQVCVVDDDRDNTALDFTLDPYISGPMLAGDYVGGSSGTEDSLVSRPTNATHKKVDNFGSTGNIARHLYFDYVLANQQRDLFFYQSANGYYQNGGSDVIVQRDIVGDRATGRPGKATYTYTTDQGFGTNNGAITISANPVVQSDKLATVAAGGSVVVDVVSGATGGNGTFTLDVGDVISPNHGTAVLDDVAGTVTYTPDAGYIGTDDMYVFVESQGQFKTVLVSFLVGPGGPVAAPVAGTSFTVADHADANTIAVALADRPDTGGRKIAHVQYSTDAGATWARLTNHWPVGTTKVTLESDGTAIAAGAYNVRLRIVTDYDETTSGASADAAVTVS